MRTNRRTTSWLALWALAMQFVLSFGHVHVGDTHLAPTALAAVHDAGANAASLPDGDDSDHQRAKQDFCAVCASLSLTAHSALPVVAELLAPDDTSRPLTFAGNETGSSSSLYAHFRARAPPFTL